MKKAILTFVASMFFGSQMVAQQWAVTTNLAALADLATLNMEAAWSPAQHWTVNAGVRYNPFSFPKNESQFQQRQQTWWAGARWWPWHSYAGWWVSGKLQYQEYNFGGIISDRTEEGDKLGFGATAGYTYMLGPKVNMEFGFGLWGGYKWYTVYACPKCGRKLESGSKAFVLPNELVVAISYIF